MSFAGIDRSGNNNHFASSGLGANDQMLDSPTNNFATFNSAVRNERATFSEGNLKATTTDWSNGMSTFYVNSGKYYYETVLLNEYCYIGISNEEFGKQAAYESYFYNLRQVAAWSYYASDGYTWEADVQGTNLGTATTGDIIGVAVNLDTGKMWFAKNGTWLGSGDPAAGTNASISGLASDYYSLSASFYSAGAIINYGADSSFAGEKTAQGNQDGNEIGDFYYTPPTGFLALCTSNLPDPAVKPQQHFNTLLYTGNASTQSITGVGFQPDFVWIKNRENATKNHNLYDAVRGAGYYLKSDTTSIENYSLSTFSSFDSDGFSIGNTSTLNESNVSHVAWNWNCPTTFTPTVTSGLTSASGRSNADAGFSIVEVTADSNIDNDSSYTHNLGVVPEMIITKITSGTGGWNTYHKDLGGAGKFMELDTNNAETDASNVFETTPTSTIVKPCSNIIANGQTIVFYNFASVDGYSKVGSYRGNADADGTYVYTGFRPAWVMVKSTGVEQWIIHDNQRDTYNSNDGVLYADASTAEDTNTTYRNIDILSNGFKQRSSQGQENGSSVEYIYLAFAETPFKYANAK